MKTNRPCGHAATLFIDEFAFIRASDSSDAIGVLAAAQVIPLPSQANAELPSEIVWMPKGEHEISAFAADGSPWKGKVICDESGAQAVQATLARIQAEGHRVPLDKDHKDEEATAWVLGFRWDPALGIVAKVEWTSLGEQLLRGKVYHSFSPAFLLNKKTSRVSGFPGGGHAAGSLVNAPAFGTAMPSLIAARLAGPSTTKPAFGGNPDNTAMKELLIKILAALKVETPANATEEQLVALAAKHIDRLPEAGTEGQAIKTQLAELQSLKAKAQELESLQAKDLARRKADAKAAVEKAVARGAIAAKDEKIQAKWAGMIENDPSHAELLAALPDNPALTRVTEPGHEISIKAGLLPVLQALQAKKSEEVNLRAQIYHDEIRPLFAKNLQFNQELGLVLAANSLGTLAGELITQRTFSLLKLQFPWLFAITTDFSDVGGSLDQVVKARLKVLPTKVVYVPGTGYVRSNATTTDVPVTISNHEGVEIAFNVNEMSSGNRDLFGEQIEGAHYVIGKGLVDSVLAVITAGNFANATTQATAGLTPANSLDLMDAALGTRGVNGPRIGLLSSAVFRKLGNDTSIVSLAQFQMKEIITQSMLPPIKNIQPYEVFNLPGTGNLTGFAGTSSALAVATRVPNDYSAAMPGVGSNGSVQVVKNIDTGVSAQLVRYIDHKLAESAWRLALMWGAAKGDPAAGQRLISA